MNPHRAFARSKKVTAMADTLWLYLTDAERRNPELPKILRTYTNAQRDTLAEAAGVNTPSPETWHAFVDRVEVLVEGERSRAMVGRALVPVFRSVRAPHLTLDPDDDVWPCDRCDGDGDGCTACGGHRLVHGYDSHGAYPVALDGWREAAAPEASETRAFVNTRRAHLPPELPPAA